MPDPTTDNIKITGISVPSSIDIVAKGSITLTGKGFELNDQIQLTLSSDQTKVYTSKVSSVTDQSVTFSLPDGISSGNYKITVIRGSRSLLLGSITINIVTGTVIPDITGMTVKGMVYCDGKGIPGVVVSDGYEVTKTNNDGIYYLPSQKKSGFVFISVPGNYEVSTDNNIPQFFKRLSKGTTVEQKDFSLTSVDNNSHVVLAMADWHLANRNDDKAQYNNLIVPDVNSTISTYQAAGKKVYVLTLGDMTWDLYWYSNQFGLSEYIMEMKNINCPVFNMMGNHDNDPYFAGDWYAEAKFKDIIGPSYYSFNIGNVHYVVLDNIEYLNAGGSQGVVGSRNYNDVIAADQLEWLKKDLAAITDKNTPIVVGMHIQLNRNPALDANGNQTSSISLNNGSALISALQDFKNIHILTGHTHINYSVEVSGSLMEHNTAAVCATWWWTGRSGYAGNHICTDGSPGGYGVWEMNGTDIKWYYKSAGYTKDYQFRSYDLNTTHITAAKFAPASTDAALSAAVGPYATPSSSNEVLINVWGYDPKWKVEVKETGKSLIVNRVLTLDPLHIISYNAKRINAGVKAEDLTFPTTITAHMFKVTASSPTSTLDITVTDRFGNVYTETMTRPKEFTYSMK
ncbi:MAG: calcineurin-like phosphoesterase family protein [Prolixibacteraceae bacterium]|nr:calcineurin-like phosphoesterase family protein [Prolixibacteraceae bacterium]